MSLGTLAASGFFTPGDVKNEAAILHSATLALGKTLGNRLGSADLDLLAAWDAFIEDEKDFYGRSQSFFYFVDFSDNATRDQVLQLERRYNDLKVQIAAVPSDDGMGAAEQLDALPDFAPDAERVQHSVLAEKGGPAAEAAHAAAGVLDKVTDTVKSIGWEAIAGAGVVLVAVGAVVVLVARSGAVKVGVSA